MLDPLNLDEQTEMDSSKLKMDITKDNLKIT